MVAVNMSDIANKMTINVKIIGIRRFKFKLWIARQLFKLAGTVTGMTIKFEEEPWYKSDI